MDPYEPKEDNSDNDISHPEDSLLAAYRNYKINNTPAYEDPLGKIEINPPY